VVAAVVVIVAVTLPVVVVELNVAVEGEREQLGWSTAPEGLEVSEQLSVAVPV